MVIHMNKNGLLAIKTFKLIWTLAFAALGVVLAIASEKRSKSPYTALQAHNLHEDGLISDAEYMRALGHDY